MSEETFRPFGKIPRLMRNAVITEKLDGTNAQIFIEIWPEGNLTHQLYPITTRVGDLTIAAGSRTRWITPTNDNYGFARWVRDNAEELARLGPGHHYGEWWGAGIQRNYGLAEKRFSLFNTARWNNETPPACCHVVPVLHQGRGFSQAAENAIVGLRMNGSVAAPGFMQPEGVVVFHEASGRLYKVTCEHDDEPKNAHPRKERLLQDKKPKSPWTGGRRLGSGAFYRGKERRELNGQYSVVQEDTLAQEAA